MANGKVGNPRVTSPGVSLLERPAEQRLREYRYRFGQAVVFGLPVVALHLFGRSLGGPSGEAVRWSGLFQALLAGWVVYVAATGMLSEGIILLLARRKLTPDLPAAAAAVGIYVWSVARLALTVTAAADAPPAGFAFHWSVIVLAAWSGLRWLRMSRHDKSLR